VGISKTNPKKKTQLQFSCNRWEVVCHWVKGPLPFFFPSTPCRWNHQFWCNFDWKSWKTIATYKSSVVVDMGICVSLFFLFLIFLCTFFSKFMACLLIKFCKVSSIQSPNFIHSKSRRGVHYYWLPWSTVDDSWPWKCGTTWGVSFGPHESWTRKSNNPKFLRGLLNQQTCWSHAQHLTWVCGSSCR